MFAAMGRPHLTRLMGRAAVRNPLGGAPINISDAIIGESSPAESDEQEDGPVINYRRFIQASSEYFTAQAGGAAQAGETWEIDGLVWDFDTQTPVTVHAGMVHLAVTRFADVNKTRQGRETH